MWLMENPAGHDHLWKSTPDGIVPEHSGHRRRRSLRGNLTMTMDVP